MIFQILWLRYKKSPSFFEGDSIYFSWWAERDSVALCRDRRSRIRSNKGHFSVLDSHPSYHHKIFSQKIPQLRLKDILSDSMVELSGLAIYRRKKWDKWDT